jgi:hypothetical protein
MWLFAHELSLIVQHSTVKLHFAICRYIVRTLSITRFFIQSSDTATHFPIHILSQLEPVDLYKILKFSLLVRRNIVHNLPKKNLTALFFCFSLLLVVIFLYRCWLPAFLIWWKNNEMLLLPVWNWDNYGFWNLLYCDPLSHSNHRNIVHKISLFAKYTHVFCMPYDSIYECILMAFCSREQSGVWKPFAHLAVRFLYLLTAWRFWSNFTIILAPTGRIRLLQ